MADENDTTPERPEDNPTAFESDDEEHAQASEQDDPDASADEVNPLTTPTNDEGEPADVADLIDPDDATAAGGTARADALLGADTVDEELGDDAPARPERGAGRDPLTPDHRAPGLGEDEVDADDEDLDNETARARARRDAFVDQVLGRDQAIRSAFGGGRRVHPASSSHHVTPAGWLSFDRDEDGNAICEVCGQVIDEEDLPEVARPSRQSAARHDLLHDGHPTDDT